MLTNYNGTAITYDAIGNPLNWRNAFMLEWYGRNLITFAKPTGEMYAYTYNADGIRTSKNYYNAGGNLIGTDEYIYDGTKLIAENRSGTWLYYFYDANGAVTGMSYGGTLYYFRKNLQGDVTGIYNATGNLVVEYEYTPYGALLAVTDASGNDISANASHIANINPFRYRGYYYDTETGLYYLITRYYDPVVGRFINEDGLLNGGIISANLFAYCCNNPIRYIDPCGTCPHDGKVYQDGNFEGLPQYNPNCGKCASHGSYSLIGKDGKSYGFRDTSRPFSEKPSQEEITIAIEGTILNNCWQKNDSLPGDLFAFYNYVSNGRSMDYKDPYIWAQAFPDIPYLGENKDYIVFGIEMSASDIGNFNYGAFGKSFGFKLGVLLWQAGAAQLRDHEDYGFLDSEFTSLRSKYFGDEEDDYNMIKRGFNMF